MVAERLEVLHDHAQPTHAEPILEASTVCSVFQACAVVEALLGLAPVDALCEVRPEEVRVDAAEVAFGDVLLEDVGLDEEYVAQLANELEAFVEGRDGE